MNAPDCAAILADLLLAQGPSGWACPEAVGPLAFEFTGMVPSFGTVFRHPTRRRNHPSTTIGARAVSSRKPKAPAKSRF